MRSLICALAVAWAATAQAQADPSHAQHAVVARPDRTKAWQETLAKPSLATAVAFGDGGRLWRLMLRSGRLEISRSDDLGSTFTAPTPLTLPGEKILGDGENRPKLAVLGQTIYVSYTLGLDKPMTGDIRFVRSVDGGTTFSAPTTINDNREVISHRFDALVGDRHGNVALVWLDKRDLEAAQHSGTSYKGAAVYVAQSRDYGRTFAPNQKLADHSCECCRIGLAADTDGTPVAFWRHVFDGGIRDFALARLDEAPRRASEDGWRIDACPHHGGDIAIDARGGRHLVWFTGAENKAGLYYRRIDGERATVPVAFGDADAQAGHPAVLVHGERVFVAWREFDGRQNRIRVMASADRGTTWGAPSTWAASAGASDYPLLLSGRGQAWLAWNTADEGFRLVALGAAE